MALFIKKRLYLAAILCAGIGFAPHAASSNDTIGSDKFDKVVQRIQALEIELETLKSVISEYKTQQVQTQQKQQVQTRKKQQTQKQQAKLLVPTKLVSDHDSLSASMLLFGNFRGSVNSVDDDEAGSTQDGASFRNNGSVLGFKGDVRVAGIKAFYKHLLRSHNDATFSSGSLQSLYYYAGLEGRFGNFKTGIISTPYKLPALEIDPFYDTAAAARTAESNNGGFDGSGFGLSLLSMGFTKNALAYQSPGMGGFKFDAAIYVDDDNNDRHDYNLGVVYKRKQFKIGLQHLIMDKAKVVAFSSGRGNASRLWTYYKAKKWSLGASYEDVNINVGKDQEHYFISGTYYLNDRLQLAASAGHSDNPDPANNFRDGDGYTIGSYYEILPNFKVYGLFSEVNRDKSGLDDRQVYSMGLIYNFAWKHTLN